MKGWASAMSDNTKIEWTDATWNPITGCSVVSPGCTNCYAMKLAGTRLRHHPTRKGLTTDSKAGPVWNGQVRLNESMLDQPLSWRRPRMIFVCAHGDLFHEAVPDEWIDRVFAVMALCPQHQFQVLTKRPERMRAYLNAGRPHWIARRILDLVLDRKAPLREPWPVKSLGNDIDAPDDVALHRWPLPNVWLGVSVEDQARADERIPILLDTPAALRWISAEPLLGPVDLSTIDVSGDDEIAPLGWGWLDRLKPGETEHPRLEWVVAGGESGPGARPAHPDWFRSLRDQCAAAGIAFHFKQWGAWAPADHDLPSETQENEEIAGRLHWPMHRIGKKAAGRLLDGVQHDGIPEVRP